ncbi:MAG: hypothetical protein WBZ42_06890 [Halobacteriota archaeon]
MGNRRKPQLSIATITNPTLAKPTFVPDRTGTYKLQLIVNDGYVDSAPITVSVTVKPTKATVVQDLQNLQTSSSKLAQANFKNQNSQETLNESSKNLLTRAQ